MDNLQKHLKKLSPEKRELVLQKLRAKKPILANTEGYLRQSIVPVSRDEDIPLSFAQQRLWFLDQLEGQSALYNIPVGLRLTGQLRMEALERSLEKIVQRHEALRTTFATKNGLPNQIIAPVLHISLPVIDLRQMPDVERNAELQRLALEEAQKPFDLVKGPLIRWTLLRMRGSKLEISEPEHVLLITMHHIISDGWSTGILSGELSVLYDAFIAGKPSPLPELSIQYADFACWQREWLRGKTLETQLSYWKKQLANAPSVLELPTDRPRSAVQTFEGSTETYLLNADLTQRLKYLTQQSGATLFMTLLAAFVTLLSRYSGQEDIVIGSPIANRNRKEIESLIGFFVNTLVLRADLSENPSFNTLLERVKQVALDAYAHQDVPFEQLVEELRPERNLSHAPLFQVMFILQNIPTTKDMALSGLKIESLVVESNRSHFDLTLVITETVDSELSCVVGYNTDLFDAVTITRLFEHFQILLDGIAANPSLRISELPLLTEVEQHKLLTELNDTQRDYSYNKCVHRLFESQAELTPNAAAVIFDKQELSYTELNTRANQLAHLLRGKGVVPDTIVGLMTERSPEMVIGILAILKAGGAYLPIDPEYPEERIISMLNDSGASLLLTKERFTNDLAFTSLQNIQADYISPIITLPRPAIQELDELPHPDRTLVAYQKYHRALGIAPAKHTVSLLTSRGCPFHCLYCHDIWPKRQKFRSAENILDEIRYCYNAGVRRFVIVDDIFNLNKRNSSKLLQELIKQKLAIQLFFPNGLRGDVLTKEYIDLMVEAGTVNIDVALESASPRIQKLIRKNLKLEKFKKNVEYITKHYPHVILEMELMIGFPTETEEEAQQTFDFLNNLRWVHFPNLNILKIFPNTEMEAVAREHGVSKASIEQSANRAYHELPDTLPFPKHFARQYQARFMNEYFLRKERLVQVLPAQMNTLTENELVQKYNSYLPAEINSFADILSFAGLTEDELGDAALLKTDVMAAPDFDKKIRAYFPQTVKKADKAFRVLLLDLSLLFSTKSSNLLYDMIEAPLGLMYLMTYLNTKFGEKVTGKIAKSRIDFDNFNALKVLIEDFKPQLIGIRTLSVYKNFFHQTVSLIRQWNPEVPIITGGPYASSEYDTILADLHVNVVVVGEGELTFAELIEKIIDNNGKWLEDDVIAQIQGLVFVPRQRHSMGKTEGIAKKVFRQDRRKDILAQPLVYANFERNTSGNKIVFDEQMPAQGVIVPIRSSMVRKKTEGITREVLMLDHMEEVLARQPSTNLEKHPQEGNLAYLLYTSGSTGKPKGVAMVQRALSNLILWHLDHKALSKKAKTLQFAPFSFDVSFQEMFSTWCAGGTLVLISDEIRRDTVALLRFIEGKNIERLFLPFVALQQLAEVVDKTKSVPTSLREVITAGEQLRITPAIAALFKQMKNCTLHNHYGPSESHVVTAFTMAAGSVDTWPMLPPIGTPIANTQIYILDRYGQPVPVGIPGELHIGGVALARGYLGMPKLTDNKFIPDPFSHKSDARLYKTGDRTRYLADGNIEYLGRIDNQVKIRGFRIEPGEIEAVLTAYSKVQEVAVIVWEYQPSDKRLVAYIVPDAGGQVTSAELRDYIKEKLPEYMMPSVFIMLDKLPLTSSGKVNRRALPAPEVAGNQAKDYVPPSTPTEEVLAAIWAEVLQVKQVGIYDNFFELGGHSLLATQLISRIREAFSVEVPVRRLFESATIADLSKHIEMASNQEQAPPIIPVARDMELPLSFAQERLWFLDQLEGQSANYNMPAAVHLTGSLQVAALEYSLTEIIRRHEVLRTTFATTNGQPVQVINPAQAIVLPVIDLQHLSKDEQPAAVRHLIDEEALRPFDLVNGPLFRSTLLRLHHHDSETQNDEYILLVTMHHIVSDGWSIGIFIREWSLLYAERLEEVSPSQKTPSSLPELPLQYADFAFWQRQWLSGEVLETQLNYWKRQLAGLPPLLKLSTARQPLSGNSLVETESFELNIRLTKALKTLARKSGASLFMTLLVAFVSLLSLYSGREDIVVGSPIANRNRREIESLIGFFVNTLVLRVELSGNPNFRELLSRVRRVALDAYAHQDVPFEKLVKELRPDRIANHHPLVQIVFTLQNAPMSEPELPGINMNILSTPRGAAKFDLILSMTETEQGLMGMLEYNSDLFDAASVALLADHFGMLLEKIVTNPDMLMLETTFVEEETLTEEILNDETEQFEF